MPRFTEVPSTLGKNSRNAKVIYQLLKIAKTTEESIFQRNVDYIKLKAKKININEIEFILSGFYHMNYSNESIYWNLRALEEKVCDKETRYHFFNNLIHLYDNTKEYELVLEYGQTAQAWLESNDVNVYWNDCTMYDCLGHAANELKRYEEAKKYFKIRLKYCKYILQLLNDYNIYLLN